MSDKQPIPAKFASKHPESLPLLLTALRDLQVTVPKAIRTAVHLYPPSIYSPESQNGQRERKITSWKMTEHMYFKKSNVFPTFARGLFTEEVADEDPLPPTIQASATEEGARPKERIVMRGYDKFFNTGEVAWTEWDAMSEHTEGPYYLTLKSNGCIIFISALSPTQLVVGSKHSLGTTKENEAKAEAEHKRTSEGIPDITTLEPSRSAGEMTTLPPREVEPKKEIESDKPGGLATNACPQPHPQPEAAPTGPSLENLSLEDSQSPKRLTKAQINAEKLARKMSDKELRKEEKIPESKKEDASESTSTKEKADNIQLENPLQHAEVGRQWVKRSLEKSGKTEEDLAKQLWESNRTAVLELCDDSFEEHVIATPEHWTGLHLHGLNANTPHFSTAHPSAVTDFAKEFGFIETKYVELATLQEVRAFTDDIAKTGSWEGDVIEGFVVRCTVKESKNPGSPSTGEPPYKIGAPFFFKVKFEEPYLLYRQFREITRVMLPLLGDINDAEKETIWRTVRSKAKRPEVKVYHDWVARMMKEDPALFNEYNTGVVRVRDRFLNWTETEGNEIWEAARSGKGDNKSSNAATDKTRKGLPKKWVIAPAAIPGCGKTSIGVALSEIFGFGHTQSDNVTTKKTAPTFISNIKNLLLEKDVVFADRCNHIPKHYYDEICKIPYGRGPIDKELEKYDIRIIAITWDLDTLHYYRLLRILSDRVVSRGENHQTLRPDPSVDAEHEAIVSRHLRSYEAPDPKYFDDVIGIKVLDTPREALEKVIAGLVGPLGLKSPSEEDIDRGLAAAEGYRVGGIYRPPHRVGRQTRYFGVAPEIDLAEVTRKALESLNNRAEMKESARTFLNKLVKDGRVNPRPHVTLCHENSVKDEMKALGRAKTPGMAEKNGEEKSADETPTKESIVPPPSPGPEEVLWETCLNIATHKYPPLFSYTLTHIVWDDRTMAYCVSDLHPQPGMAPDGTLSDAPDVNDVLPQETKLYLHVTVGTRDVDVPAFESRGLVRAVRENLEKGLEEGEIEELVEGGGKVRWVKIDNLHGEGRIRGMS